ncbi:hypothetical protein IJM86_01365 [bacterium]|nr:hypothetical protein [bacterium]
MKRFLYLFVALLSMSVVMTITSCVKEEGDIFITNYDTIIITIGGDSLSIDNSSRSYSDPEINVNGGSVSNTITGNNGCGENGVANGELQIVVPAGYHCWQVPVPEVSFHYDFVGGEDERFNRFYPSTSEVPVGFYDSNENPTTLSFDFDDWSNGGGYSNGKYGSDFDKIRDLMILRIYDEFAEIKPFRMNKKYVGYSEYGKSYLVGLTGRDGNSPDEKTGRTLMGVSEDGHVLLLMVAEEATSLEAYDTFVHLFPHSPVMVLGGGNSSRCFLPKWYGTRTVPLTIRVADSMKL